MAPDLELHRLAQLAIECAERLVEQQHVRPRWRCNEGHAEIRFDNAMRLTARADLAVGTQVGALIRPERLRLAAAGTQSINRLCGEVIETIYLGTSHKYRVRLTNGTEFLVRVRDTASQATAEIGASLTLDVAPEDVHVFRHE